MVKRFDKAGESSRFPWSPPGFIVPIILKSGCALISSAPAPPFSARVRVLPASKTLHACSRQDLTFGSDNCPATRFPILPGLFCKSETSSNSLSFLHLLSLLEFSPMHCNLYKFLA